jgi:hypothetical protein
MFVMHSNLSLFGLWRFLTRQRKQRAFFRDTVRHSEGQFGEANGTLDLVSSMSLQSKNGGSFDQFDWSGLFEDPSRPLVNDIGCGMGVLLLHLATSPLQDNANYYHCADNEILTNLGGCNFIDKKLQLSCRAGVRTERAIQAGTGWLLSVCGQVGGRLPSEDW